MFGRKKKQESEKHGLEETIMLFVDDTVRLSAQPDVSENIFSTLSILNNYCNGYAKKEDAVVQIKEMFENEIEGFDVVMQMQKNSRKKYFTTGAIFIAASLICPVEIYPFLMCPGGWLLGKSMGEQTKINMMNTQVAPLLYYERKKQALEEKDENWYLAMENIKPQINQTIKKSYQ